MRVGDTDKAEVGSRCDTRGRKGEGERGRINLPKVGQTSHKTFRNEDDFPALDKM